MSHVISLIIHSWNRTYLAPYLYKDNVVIRSIMVSKTNVVPTHRHSQFNRRDRQTINK